ncbi:putative rna-directed dna polymerase from transposon bs [Trichonephila clavipes]|nr:putative rna-directed dna polymerase from transposon bs [Trichonephila clavipes]
MKLIELGKSKEGFALQWIRSHCNISGNKQADRPTKVGSLMSHPDSSLPLGNIKIIIYSKLQINIASLYDDATTVPSSLLLSVGVACFRLLTGHDYLQKHLYRIGVKYLACCHLCHQG